MTLTDYMCQEKKTVLTHQYNDLKTTYKERLITATIQLQYRQHEDHKNDNNQKIKIERKTTLWTFEATNKQHITRENIDVAKKGKP